jgi:hypothetical protein
MKKILTALLVAFAIAGCYAPAPGGAAGSQGSSADPGDTSAPFDTRQYCAGFTKGPECWGGPEPSPSQPAPTAGEPEATAQPEPSS